MIIDNFLSKYAPSGARTHGLRITTGLTSRKATNTAYKYGALTN